MLSDNPVSPSPSHSPSISPSPKSHIMMNSGSSDHQEKKKHIWVITGPAGCGKTTVGMYLAKELLLPYIEGDDVCSFSTSFLLPIH